MPGFIHSEKDEARWDRAKKAASKSLKEGSDSFWALSNYIYHKMGKSQEDIEKAEHFKKTLFGLSNSGIAVSEKAPSLHIPYAMKMPKPKKMPSATAKPSVFFKKEDFDNVKHPSTCKLRDFLENRIARKQS